MIPRIFVVEPYVPNGGTYMAYHVAKIFSETFGFEPIAVGLTTADHGVFNYSTLFPLITIEKLAAEITLDDVLIANPSFSAHHFGLSLPGRKLMYVQGFNTFSLLDCRFDHYVAVSHVVQRLLAGVYDIQAPIIPAFINDIGGIEAPDWMQRRKGSIVASPKLPQVYLNHLQHCLNEQGCKVELSYLPTDKIPQTELMRIIGQHQFFLSLSPAEGFGLMPLEAMAMGTVVVGFDGFGGRDFMRSGENCLVVPYCEIEHLAALIGSAMNDMTVGQRLSDASRITAQKPEFHYPSFRDAWTREMKIFMSAAKSQRITGK